MLGVRLVPPAPPDDPLQAPVSLLGPIQSAAEAGQVGGQAGQEGGRRAADHPVHRAGGHRQAGAQHRHHVERD